MSKEKNRKNRTMGLIVMEIRRGIEIVKEEKMDVEDLMSKVIKLGERSGEL